MASFFQRLAQRLQGGGRAAARVSPLTKQATLQKAVFPLWDAYSPGKAAELVQYAKCHILFLEKLHSLGVTLTKPSTYSLQRYKGWLSMLHQIQIAQQQQQDEPMVSSTTIMMIPPADVAWLWHCHRLAPYHYIEYLEKEFGISPNYTTSSRDTKQQPHPAPTILEANPPFEFQHANLFDSFGNLNIPAQGQPEYYLSFMETTMKNTQQTWQQHYPNDPFFYTANGKESEQQSSFGSIFDIWFPEEEQKETATTSSIKDDIPLADDEWCGLDLVESTQRQAEFLWQVSQPKFDDDSFWELGIENYYKFLRLQTLKAEKQRAAAPKRLPKLVPTYQIDLFWHTHILTNLQDYRRDCQAITEISSSFMVNHDDSLTDRSEGGDLERSYHFTKGLWKEAYNEEYYCTGGMYRGPPPKDFYDRDWRRQHQQRNDTHTSASKKREDDRWSGGGCGGGVSGCSSTHRADDGNGDDAGSCGGGDCGGCGGCGD